MQKKTYDSIGAGYNSTRAADPRILTNLVGLSALPAGATIADIGAGTGNYSNALARLGYKMIAIEPSEEMQKQAAPNANVTWLSCFAEAISLPDNCVNGAIIVLALHHFKDASKAISELKRICPDGPVVVFTMDPREGREFWFYSYFPEIEQHVIKTFPPLKEIIELFAQNSYKSATVRVFPLPGDLIDRNMCSGWKTPEKYLDEEMRRNTSGFALASPDTVRKGLARLQEDLVSGKWDREYGALRKRTTFDAGFRFIRFKKQG